VNYYYLRDKSLIYQSCSSPLLIIFAHSNLGFSCSFPDSGDKSDSIPQPLKIPTQLICRNRFRDIFNPVSDWFKSQLAVTLPIEFEVCGAGFQPLKVANFQIAPAHSSLVLLVFRLVFWLSPQIRDTAPSLRQIE
jgi:hypothetical protein